MPKPSAGLPELAHLALRTRSVKVLRDLELSPERTVCGTISRPLEAPLCAGPNPASAESPMPNEQALDSPLLEEEWERLEELFARPGGPNRNTIFGLLHAVASAPNMIPPSAWLPIALGDRDFGDDPAPFLLLRHYNEVNEGLAAGQIQVPEAENADGVRDWCVGYMLGVRLDGTWLDRDDFRTVFPIMVLSGEAQLSGEGGVEDGEAWFEKAREDLGGVALDGYWKLESARSRRAPGASSVQRPFRREVKVGRNAPCPCGSGKKHKKCCLGRVA